MTTDFTSIAAKAAEADETVKKRKRRRLILIIVLLAALLVAAIVYLISKFNSDTGWRDVTVTASAGESAGIEFTFRYRIDRNQGGRDFTAVQKAYTDACVRLYKIFDVNEAHEGIAGMYALNASNGERITVEPELYTAFEILEKSGFRGLYLGPVYQVYEDLFFAEDPLFARQNDPYYDTGTAAYIKELAKYCNNPAKIDLKLCGNNQVELQISADYRVFAKMYGISVFLDFFWMKNAFVLEELTKAVQATGYLQGYIVSNAEGYVSCLDPSGEIYESGIYDREGNVISRAGTLSYTGPARIVTFLNYAEEETYEDYFYEYEGLKFATAFIDPKDGLYKSAANDLMIVTDTLTVPEILLAGADLFIAEELDEEKIASYAEQGMEIIWCRDKVLTVAGEGPEVSAVNGYRLERLK